MGRHTPSFRCCPKTFSSLATPLLVCTSWYTAARVVSRTNPSDGRIRTDAGIMTDDRDVGAACAMPGVKHAIDVADAVRTETPHILLAGDEAVAFADANGIETDADLWTARTRARWEDQGMEDLSRADQCRAVRERFGAGHDTVGAVATDGQRVVAGTSTGGRQFALAGRVGDVPQVGSGFFATSAGGASTTGAGEDIARVTLAREAVAHLESGATPEHATTQAMDTFDRETDGTGGLLALAPTGDAGVAFSSGAMQSCHAVDGAIRRPAQTQYL